MSYLRILGVLFICVALHGCGSRFVEKNIQGSATLERNFDDPPIEARLRAYWWWVNGNVTRESITRDLEEMKDKGFGGAVLCDMDRSYIGINDQVPHGPDFASDEWRELYKHALREASRLGLEISLNVTSGWSLGGPVVALEDAPKKLVWTKQSATGPSVFKQQLEAPEVNSFYTTRHRAHEKPQNTEKTSFYRDIAVVAYPKSNVAPIQNWRQKALHSSLHQSTPDTKMLLGIPSGKSEERGINKNEVVNLTAKMAADGTLTWDVPKGEWEILRLGYGINNKAVLTTTSEGWAGYALDVFDAKAFEKYWDAVVKPLIEDSERQGGNALKYLHSDSWEIEPLNWTPLYPEEFSKRRGYDILPYIPALVGEVVETREISNRFLHDFRKTFGDLVIDNHYRLFRDHAHEHDLLIHPESGGPHAVPIDAQRNLGFNDVPMSEFWAKAKVHRVSDEQRFFVKQPASAAHTYGRKVVLAEGFTSLGVHWTETLWDNLKPTFDKALCEGMNLLVWHSFSCSPKEMGIPGQDSHAGVHLNPNITWWSRSAPFLSYINRSQVMMQHGLPVADVLYYYGDHVPNFSQLKSSDPAGILPGYDYDVATEEVIIDRADVKAGRIVLPDGMSYHLLMLPDQVGFSLAVLKKVRSLLEKGAVVVGGKPVHRNGLTGSEAADREFSAICDELWGTDYSGETVKERKVGKGRLVSGAGAREVLEKDGVVPDFAFSGGNADTEIDYVHRTSPSADIFFVSNQADQPEKVSCRFRVSGKQPEFWDAVTGEKWMATEWSEADGHTVVPVEFNRYGSIFVVFRADAEPPAAPAKNNFLKFDTLQTIAGDWEVVFDTKWGGPASAVFPTLVSWSEHTDPGIKYYSGTATYKKNIRIDVDGTNRGKARYFIDLGNVKELAEVRLNGKPLGIVWSRPFRVEITDALSAATNELEVDVVNFWHNRVLGDQLLPESQRYTKTNLSISKDSPLMKSGLLGPVRVLKVIE